MTLSDVYHGFFHKKLHKHPFKIILEKNDSFGKCLQRFIPQLTFNLLPWKFTGTPWMTLIYFLRQGFFNNRTMFYFPELIWMTFKVSLTQHRAYFLPFIDHIFQSQIPQSRFIKKRCIRDICCLELYLMYECFCVWSQ